EPDLPEPRRRRGCGRRRLASGVSRPRLDQNGLRVPVPGKAKLISGKRISQCFQNLGRMIHAKRYMMLALCEDSVTDKGVLNLENSGSYGRLAWVFGLSDHQIRGYATQAYNFYQENAAEATMPEWILQRFDQQWKTEIPSDQEAGTYHIT